MLDDAAAWFGVPAVCVVTALGVGLFVERLLGIRLRAYSLLPLGTCASMCLLLAVYELHGTGIHAAALVVVLAVAGLLRARRELTTRLRPGPATVAGAVGLGLYLAPSVISGGWTWYGYNFLNDTAVQFLLADELKHHGAVLLDGALSTRSESIRTYLGSGYPLATHAHLATLATLLGAGVDVAYQGYIATLMCVAAVALTGIARESGLTPWRAASAGALTLCASLIYHYALQGSIKEIGAFAALASATLLGLELLRADKPVRAVVPVGVAAAAMVGAFSTAAAPYLLVLAAGLAACGLMSRGTALRRRLGLVTVVGAGTAAILALPTAMTALTFYRVSSSALSADSVATSTLGQLQRPLAVLQVAGVYLSENYGLPITRSWESSLTSVLSWVVIGLAVVGAVVFARRRLPGPLLLALSGLLTAAAVAPRASPYADAKLLALACPGLVFVALAGALALDGRLRVVGTALASIVAAGVVASAAFAYHGVRLAPVERLQALEPAVAAAAGRGTIMLDEVEEFGKYYGRNAPQLSVAFEPITPRQAVPFGGGYHLDLDQLDQPYVQSFDAIITRNGPAQSRPPGNFRRVYGNRYYQAWVKHPDVRVQSHLPIQSSLHAEGIVRCSEVRRLAATADPGNRLLAAEPPDDKQMPVASAPDRPIGWPPLAAPPGVVEPKTPGVIEKSLPLRAGVYDAWVRASTGRDLNISVDGRRVGSVNSLNTQGQWLHAGSVRLDAGHHDVRLERPGGGLAPGDGVTSVIGPVALVRRGARPVRELPPRRATELCGKRWDWIEVVSK
jgi:hypothetical protein